jgi:hypothetical protein
MIVNLTPYPIQILVPQIGGSQDIWTISPSGLIARAVARITPADSIDGIPTARVEYDGVRDLPGPADERWYVVTKVTAQAAKQWGRITGDLLIPGEQICDADGKITGYKYLQRVQ